MQRVLLQIFAQKPYLENWKVVHTATKSILCVLFVIIICRLKKEQLNVWTHVAQNNSKNLYKQIKQNEMYC